MKDQWIDDIRTKMQDHTEPAPDGLWNDINGILNQQKIVPVPFYKRARWYAAGIGSAAAIALFFVLWNKNVEEMDIVSEQLAMEQISVQKFAEQKSGIAILAVANNSLNKNNESTSLNIKTRKNKKTLLNAANDKNLPSTSDEEPVNVTESSSKKGNLFLPLAQTPKETGQQTSDAYKGANEYTMQTPDQSYQSRQKVSIGINAANLTQANRQMNGYGEFMRGATLPDNLSTCNNLECPGTEILFENIGKETKTQKKHKQPVKIGVSVRYQFNNRFSLESGLTYSRLASELSTGSNGNYFHTDQTLDYLGIPLTASFSFWNNKRFNFYVSVGGMIEKCIAGKTDTQFYLKDTHTSSNQKHIMEKPCQFSVTGAVGAQINIVSMLSFFIEPGINYYFDNGSPIETIYKSKPLNFNLNLGFRFTV